MRNDLLPWQFWFLLLLLMIAWPLALNLWSFLKAGRTTLEIRESRPQRGPLATSFWKSVIVLLAIVLLAAFLLSPLSNTTLRLVANMFAASKLLQVLGLVGISAYPTWETWRGWTTGSVAPLSRGGLGPYTRTTQPKRYWASMAWNSLFCLGMMAATIALIAG